MKDYQYCCRLESHGWFWRNADFQPLSQYVSCFKMALQTTYVTSFKKKFNDVPNCFYDSILLYLQNIHSWKISREKKTNVLCLLVLIKLLLTRKLSEGTNMYISSERRGPVSIFKAFWLEGWCKSLSSCPKWFQFRVDVYFSN